MYVSVRFLTGAGGCLFGGANERENGKTVGNIFVNVYIQNLKFRYSFVKLRGETNSSNFLHKHANI